VILGYVGSGRKVDFTVIGSPVNLASRLSGIAKAGEILMDAEVRAALSPEIPVCSAGHSAIKGFTQPIEIFTAGAVGWNPEASAFLSVDLAMLARPSSRRV